MGTKLAQQILTDGRHELRALLGEWVLYRNVGGPTVMIDQLNHLLEVQDNRQVRLGIVPLNAEFRAPAASFVVHDTAKAETEAVGGPVETSEGAVIDLHIRTFDVLASQAAYGRDAAEIIGKALEFHHSHE